MAVKKETYKKVVDTFKKKGEKEWAKAKSGDGDHHYAKARAAFETAERARKKS